MKRFKLIGIASPGRVNLMEVGTIELENISDEMAEKLYKDGCPYLEPTPEGRVHLFPDEKPILVEPLTVVGNLKKPKYNLPRKQGISPK